MSQSSPSVSDEFPYVYRKVHPCLSLERQYSVV